MRLLRRCKLNTLLMICLSLCIALTCILQIFFITSKMKHLQETYTDALNTQIVENNAENLGVWFKGRIDELAFLAMDPAFTQGEEAIAALIRDTNARHAKLYGEGIQACIYSAMDGHSILPSGEAKDMTDSIYFISAEKSKNR